MYPSARALAHLDLALGGVGLHAVADPGSGLRWLPREQRHVTLVFHGEVPDGAVPAYVDALHAVLAGIGPFELDLAGSGTFGGRTLWVGLGGDVAVLRDLSGHVADAAGTAGLPAGDRAGGRPHLTVARASAARVGADRTRRRATRRAGAGPGEGGQGAPFTQWSRALTVYRGPAWAVTEVAVVSSALGAGRSGGPLHTLEAVVPLGGAAAARQ